MADIFTDMRQELYGILRHKIRFKYYTGSVSSGEWDDAQVLVQSGTDSWVSGLVMPVRGAFGSNEALLLEQGKIKQSDKQIFVAGNVQTDGILKIGVSGTTISEHSIIPDGVVAYPQTEDIVYKKIYARELPLGSLIGEM